MAKIGQLFDFQKIVEEPKLQEIIDETHSRYPVGIELSDDELDMVAGGAGAITSITCSKCGKKIATRGNSSVLVCPQCGNKIVLS